MNDRRDDKAKDGDDAFLTQAAELFDDSVAGLDAQTRSRLNRGRQAALAAAAKSGPGARWLAWAPLGAAAAVTAVAIVTWNGQEVPDAFTAPQAASDLEILMDGEELEMLEELEFYSWLELGDEDSGEHVG